MKTKICECCGEEFSFESKGKERDERRKFCSNKCRGISLKGKPSPSSGKKWSEESKNKIRGRHPSEETRKKLSDVHKGVPKSDEHNRKNSEAHRGENNPQWKGGVETLNNRIRGCEKYSNWRTQVFGRDNFTCQECGVRGTWLEAHHKKPFFQIIKDNNIKTFEKAYNCPQLWDINNGITLCKECHKRRNSIGTRSSF